MTNADNGTSQLSQLEQLLAAAEQAQQAGTQQAVNTPGGQPTAADLDAIVADAEIAAKTIAEGTPEATPVVLDTVQLLETLGTTVSNRPKPCGHWSQATPVALTTCPTCKWPFCLDCASALDPVYCHNCLDEPGAVLVASPLKSTDDDGVTHRGRLLTPGPTFSTVCKQICEMSDYELTAHIGHYKELIKQAELSLDFRRVVLGAGQMEQAQRADAAARRLRSVKTPKPLADLIAAAAKKAAGTSTTTKSAKPAAVVGNMLDMLKALQKLKATKAAAAQQVPSTEVQQ